MNAPVCRGDIWMVDWNPGRGSEQVGYRPGVVVQCDEGNHAAGANTTILVPLTTRGRPFLFYVPVPKGSLTGLRADSWANCTQVLTIDKGRLRTRTGTVPALALHDITLALAETLGIPTAIR